MLLTHRELLQLKAIAIENDLRGTLRNFGLKVGMVGTVRFEARIQELVENIPDLAVLVDPLLIVRRVLREQIVILHRRLLAFVRDGAISFVDILTSVNAARVSSRYRFLNTSISGENPMCDYSHTVVFRPAKVGETLVTTSFYGTFTRGFAAKREPNVAVCLLPGTELAFDRDVRYNRNWLSTRSTGFGVARFCALEPGASHQHHDALSFPDGKTVLVNLLSEGQHALVLQLPVIPREQSVDGNVEKTVILAVDPELTA
jgi:hypothetical protein